MLYTASFYAPDNWVGRAFRVSRQHPRGRRVAWETLPFFYPERELLRAYRQGDLDFDALSCAYRDGLERKLGDDPDLRRWVEAATGLGDFTLLCFEPAGQPCHRLVLAQWLLEKAPALEVGELR